MFRKIPSKLKDTTVLREFKNEFSPQVKAFEGMTKAFLDRHAELIFCSMILVIVASFILTFFVMETTSGNHSESLKNEIKTIPEGFGEEFSAFQNLSSRAIKMSELKTEIERIIGKDSISKEDSAYLEKAIEQLQYFNNQPKEDEH